MKKKAILLWALGLAILAAGAWFVCPQSQCATTAIDHVGLSLAHDIRNATLDRWMQGVTWFGSLAVLLPLTVMVALILLRHRRRPEAGFLVLAVLGASGLSHVVKLVVLRPRPDLFPAWTNMPADWSYPSAHAMQITALAVALLFIIARWRELWAVPLGSAVLLVGLSRLYLQVHYPSDVLAGILVATLWVGGLHAFMFSRSSGCSDDSVTGGRA